MEFRINQIGNIVEVEGLIKTINDSEAVIDTLRNINSDSIVLRIKDSFGLPSSIIGYLVKLKDEGKSVMLEVGSPILFELLENLNLKDTFHVRKI